MSSRLIWSRNMSDLERTPAGLQMVIPACEMCADWFAGGSELLLETYVRLLAQARQLATYIGGNYG
jgi:hypothetical protein